MKPDRWFDPPTPARRLSLPCVIAFAMCLSVCCAFTAGAFWNDAKAQGSADAARALALSKDRKLAAQGMFRLYADARLTVELFRELQAAGEWPSEEARNYLEALHKDIGR